MTNHFDTEHLIPVLKTRTIASLRLTVPAQGVKFLLQIVSISALSRLLRPEDFGLVAMVSVFVMLIAPLRDGGLSMTIVQHPKITHEQVSNLFWINLTLSVFLALLGVIAAPILALIYDEPRVTMIAVAMAVSFLLGGISVQSHALLKRQMCFGTLAIIDVLSMTIGICIAIIFALRGAGYWALVAMPLATEATRSGLALALCGWIPRLPCQAPGVWSMVRFGVNLTGAKLVGQVANSVTPFTIGILGGATVLGWYNRAITLNSIPNQQIVPPITSVLQPALSRVAANNQQFESALLSALRKTLLISSFTAVLVLGTAQWIVPTILGDNWHGAIEMLRLLALFTIVEPIAGVLGTALIAYGKSSAIFLWRCISLGIVMVAAGMGSWWGPYGVVAAVSFSGVLVRLPMFVIFSSKYLPVEARQMFNILLLYFASCVPVGLWLILFAQMNISVSAPVALCSAFVSSIIIYITVIFSVGNLRREGREIVELAVSGTALQRMFKT